MAQLVVSAKYPVNYSWSASDGSVDGTGADVRWSSAGHPTGPYTVKVRVENGRNGSAECFANLRVEQRPNRPPVIACSADRSTVTQGEPVTIIATASDPDNDPLGANPGLVVEFPFLGPAAQSCITCLCHQTKSREGCPTLDLQGGSCS
jgi:hypothetical protein